MDEKSDSGFSFGAPPKTGGVFEEDVDAIEVSGEPITRSEASRMGLANYDTGGMEPRERDAKAATSILHMDQLPGDLSGELALKLERAWEYLKKNEIEQALTLAQEVVWKYPALVAAKIIIARCFINRREYEKALAILQAISETEMSAETMYYIGLCQSRLGKVKEAISSLMLSRASSTDALTKRRANDLIQQLQGEQTECPMCGKKTLYDSMVDVGNRTVCANCAKLVAEDDAEGTEEQEDDFEFDGKGKRRKRLRRPLTKGEMLLRLVLALIILGAAAYFVYMFLPDSYNMFRSYLPSAVSDFLPVALVPPPPMQARPAQQAQQRVLPTVPFDSPPIDRAIAGLELRHQLAIDGARGREKTFTVAISPKPDGGYRLDAQTGLFEWTPAETDAGKSFTLTFGAESANFRSKDQVTEITVMGGASFRRVGFWPRFEEDSVLHLVASDFTGAGGQDLILVSGQYIDGEALILDPSASGGEAVRARAGLKGRPVGAGLILADKEKWLAVADYWSSRLRFFAYRNRALSEMAVAVDLPGRPLMAGFSQRDSLSAVLCRVDGGMRVVLYQQKGQLDSEKLGEWNVPDEFVWRRLVVFPSRGGPNGKPLAALLGGRADDAFLLLEIGREPSYPFRGQKRGLLIDAVADAEFRRIHCLIDREGSLFFSTVDLDNLAAPAEETPAGPAPALCGMAAHRSLEGKAADLMVLSSSRIGLAYGNGDRARSGAVFRDLPSPPLLMGRPAVLLGEKGAEAVFAGAKGELWAVSLAN